MNPVDYIGWGASLILIATLGRQVYTQWRERTTEGVSRWLFIGQMCASIGFVVYSWMLDNGVFVFTNSVLLLTGVVGQLIFRRNRRLAEREGAGAG